jgi:hypothetical protein
MCTYSNIGDIGRDMWPNPWGPGNEPYKFPQFPAPNYPNPMPGPAGPYNPGGIGGSPQPYNGPTKEQFEEFLKLMRQARKFDEAMGHPNCEQREKLEWMKGIAEYLGCDVSDLIPK